MEPPGDFLQALHATELPRLHEPGNEKHTLSWLYQRSARGLDPDTLTVLQVAGQVAHDLFPAFLAVEALGGTDAESRGRAALRRLVLEGFLQITESDWQFTHVLPYQFSHELGALGDDVWQRLATWAEIDFRRAVAAFGRTYDTMDICRALRHVLAVLEGPFLRTNPELMLPLMFALPKYSVRLRDVAAQLVRALYDRITTAREAGRPELNSEVARSAHRLAIALSELGQCAGALVPAQEAVELRRALVQRNPDAFQPDLARALGTLGWALAGNERHEDALGSYAEAMQALIPHFQRWPAPNQRLMSSLFENYERLAAGPPSVSGRGAAGTRA